MKAKSWLLRRAIRKKIDEHADEIEAEKERLKKMRSMREFREYGVEKSAEFKKLWRERGPEVKKLLKDELERYRERQSKKGGK
jgi:hypothetical protein